MNSIVIYRTLNRFSVSQLSQMLYEEVCFERVRMVVVNELTLFERYLVVRSVIIVIIDDGDPVTEFILNTVCEC